MQTQIRWKPRWTHGEFSTKRSHAYARLHKPFMDTDAARRAAPRSHGDKVRDRLPFVSPWRTSLADA